MKLLVVLLISFCSSFAFAAKTWKFEVTNKDMATTSFPILKTPAAFKIGDISCTVKDLSPEDEIQFKEFVCVAGETIVSKLSGCAPGGGPLRIKYNRKDETRPVVIRYKGQQLAFLLFCE